MVWTIELKPGKKHELTYKYDLYVHRYGKTSY